jgi:hypothetical protein
MHLAQPGPQRLVLLAIFGGRLFNTGLSVLARLHLTVSDISSPSNSIIAFRLFFS